MQYCKSPTLKAPAMSLDSTTRAVMFRLDLPVFRRDAPDLELLTMPDG
jgi:hypothetical protein